MRIVVLGATGNVGSRFTRQAADAGNEIVAYVRRPDAVPPQPGVTVVEGRLDDASALAAAEKGADAVLVAISGKMTDGSFMRRHLPAIIDATQQAGVERIVLTSVFGAGDTEQKASGLAKLVYKTVLRKFLADKAAGNEMLQRSGLEWTIAYLVNLKAAAPLPEKAAVEPLSDVAAVPGMPTLPMDNAAEALLRIVTDPSTIGERLLVTTPHGWKPTS